MVLGSTHIMLENIVPAVVPHRVTQDIIIRNIYGVRHHIPDLTCRFWTWGNKTNLRKRDVYYVSTSQAVNLFASRIPFQTHEARDTLSMF